MNLVNVTASRTYTAGPLAGRTITVDHKRIRRSLAPKVGDEKAETTESGDAYVETVTKVQAFNLRNGCGC